MRTFLALLTLIALPAWGCDSINIGAKSHHWDQSTNYNEVHRAAGCRNLWKGWDVLAFENSYNDPALAVTRYWSVRQFGRWDFGFDYGFVVGYERYPVLIGLLPRAQWDGGTYKVNGYILGNAGVAVGLEFEL